MGGHHSGGLFGHTTGDKNPKQLFKVLHNGEYKFTGEGNLKELNLSKKTKEQLVNNSKTVQCKKLINELYRDGATVGDGSTADAIREQISTGKLVGNKDHIQKGKERLRQIKNILSKEPNHPDKDILEFLANDLKCALGGN
jgi:hypothetical protein